MTSSIQRRKAHEFLEHRRVAQLTSCSWSTSTGSRWEEKRRAAVLLGQWLDGIIDRNEVIDHLVVADLVRLLPRPWEMIEP